jgi:hypothetical protein
MREALKLCRHSSQRLTVKLLGAHRRLGWHKQHQEDKKIKTKFVEGAMKFTRLTTVYISFLFIFLLPLSAHADFIGGNDIIPRTTRDGVVGTTYVDMTHTIQSDSLLTEWNIWAQDYAVTWPSSTAPRSVKLIIFRSNNSDLEVVGKSGLETVQEWNRAYHFDLTNPIQAKAGDLIGWYDAAGVATPGGVISFEWATSEPCLTRWAYNVEISGTTPLSDFYPGEGRIYSINVGGSPVPIPAAAWLFGSGLAGLVGLKRKFFV